MHVEGTNGSVDLDGDTLRIRHKGFANILTAGVHGEISIPLENVSAVQFKAPGVMAGFIQFTIIGGNIRPGGVMEATKDVNAVLFQHKTASEFEALRSAVDSRLSEIRSARSAPIAAISIADELLKLANLKEKGILSESEFQSQKEGLLTSPIQKQFPSKAPVNTKSSSSFTAPASSGFSTPASVDAPSRADRPLSGSAWGNRPFYETPGGWLIFALMITAVIYIFFM